MCSLRLVGLLLVALLFTGCNAFDDDAQYVPEYKTSLLLVQRSGGLHLDALTPAQGYQPDFHLRAGITAPAAIALDGDNLLLSDSAAPRLVVADPVSGAVRGSFVLPFVADAICRGNESLLILNRAARKVAFIQLTATSASPVRVFDLDWTPLFIAYSETAKYLVVGNDPLSKGRTLLLSEPALTELASHTLNRPAAALSLNSTGRFLIVSTPNGSPVNPDISIHTVDPLGYGLDTPAGTPQANTRQYQPSNMFRPLFGREFLRPVRLLSSTRRTDITALTDTLSRFEMDFEGSRILYQRQDSLFQFDAARATYLARVPFSGQLHSALHYYLRRQ